jgi:hypothetical protein
MTAREMGDQYSEAAFGEKKFATNLKEITQ